MANQVINRDGCQVAFDQARIEAAIRAAAKAAKIDDDDYCANTACCTSAISTL
ncbi:ATP cone domain-containing protein [Erwinia amylovora]|uniref:ATP cone domain-containing protein n=1 Tax=Erwinia amylovora TaxID=552 RepID=UPI003855D9C4